MSGQHFSKPITIFIKQKSVLAYIASKCLHTNKAAIVLGSYIFIYGCNKEQFIANTKWFNHELQHVHQYQQLGFVIFISKYIYYSFKYGYYLNPFEVDARNHELKRANIFANVRIK